MKTYNELKLAKELIRFPTITPVDAGIMKYLSKKLKVMGFKTKILEFKENQSVSVKNLYARFGNKSPNFCYAGHVDVVPPGNIKDWKIHPFKPSIKNGYLIGRGANDMKSSVAAFIAAVSRFLNKNKKIKGSISLLITGDEEGIAINGTKKVVQYLKNKKEKINFCLVGEPTNPNKLGEMIKIGRRGSLTGNLIINGLQGHVAYPQRAKNPSTCIIEILKKLKEIKFDSGNKNFQPTNLEVTKININNNADNVIPGKAEGTFNIRFNNKHNSRSLKKKINTIIRNICQKHKCKSIIEYRISGEAFLTKPNKTSMMIKKIISKNTKVKTKFSTTGGTSDARFIKSMAPCIEFGLVGKTMHKVDEVVSLSDLKKLSIIYERILIEYFK